MKKSIKNIFNRILRCCRKLEEVKCQIVLAQAELRKTNEKLAAAKDKLETMGNMLHEKQDMFVDVSTKLHQEQNKLNDTYTEHFKAMEAKADITRRYEVAHAVYKKIFDELDRLKRRTKCIENGGVKLDIPSKDIEKWMEETFITNPETGRTETIASFCLNTFIKKKHVYIQQSLDVWNEVQKEVKTNMEKFEWILSEANLYEYDTRYVY